MLGDTASKMITDAIGAYHYIGPVRPRMAADEAGALLMVR